MPTHIALFRGINVGGHHILPMQKLVALLEELGCTDVATYIQSGNAVFRHRAGPASLSKKIRAAVGEHHDFEPEVLLLTHEELARAANGNPFSDAETDPKTLHIFFLASVPRRPDLKAIEGLRAVDERCKLSKAVFYLHAPNGIARSKLAARVDRALGVAATARNWRTVQKILELAQAAN